MRSYLLNRFCLSRPDATIIFFLFEGAGEMYYYVVFNGFHVTEQKITSYSKNDKVCFCTLFLIFYRMLPGQTCFFSNLCQY